MPSTRARTCATRYAEVRPGSSVTTGTADLRTVTTETSGGCGDGGACLAFTQPPRTTSAVSRYEVRFTDASRKEGIFEWQRFRAVSAPVTSVTQSTLRPAAAC